MTNMTQPKELTQHLTIFTIEIAYAAVKAQRMLADMHDMWRNFPESQREAYIAAEKDLEAAYIAGKKGMEEIRRGGPKLKVA